MKLRELLDVNLLSKHLDDRNITQRLHPHKDWVIYNYAPKVQFEKLWDEVTLQCRGLVVDTNTSEVIARPFKKFFNYEEVQHKLSLPENIVVHVFEKLDGALGIGVEPGYITTRGSFQSDHAEAAMDIWKNKYNSVRWPEGKTPLWEIIHPVTRVVVDYKDTQDLYLLGMVDIKTGRTDYSNDWWPGPKAQRYSFEEFAKLAKAPYNNTEGFVLHIEHNDTRVKVKYPEYVELHRVVVGLNERAIFDNIKNSASLKELLEKLPDELNKWAQSVANNIWGNYHAINDRALSLFHSRPRTNSRKEFAEWALAQTGYSNLLFKLLDNKTQDYQRAVFNKIEEEMFP